MSWQPPDLVTFRRRFTAWTFLWLVLAIWCAVQWKMGEKVAAPFGAACLFLALTAFFSARGALTLRFRANEMEQVGTGRCVAFNEIRGLALSNAPLFDEQSAAKARYFIIAHAGGAWWLPAAPTVDRLRLYEYLLGRSTLFARPARMPGRLEQVLGDEEALFPGRVVASAGRPLVKGETISVLWPWPFVVAWLVAGCVAAGMNLTHRDVEMFFVFAGVSSFLAILLSLLFWARRNALRKRRAACGIVVSPRALTLDTPELKGVLKWAEIQNVRVVNTYAFRGLSLDVDGVNVLIGDDYAFPLTEIHRVIKSHWSHERE